MFCYKHSVPHEDCADCRPTVTRMRPTVFAELAAAELHRGTGCCTACEYLYFGQPARCPRCKLPVQPAGAKADVFAARPPALGRPAGEAEWVRGLDRRAERSTAGMLSSRPATHADRARKAEV